MDTNYLDRVTARRATLAEHGSVVHGVTPAGHAAVAELYAYLLGTYLPARYPSMFELITSTITPARGQQQPTKLFRNKVTNLAFPLHPPPSDPCEMLRVLGETVEDDMFLLLRDLNPDSEQEHRAVAFVCCHPAGFAPASKLGRRLAEIHGPVPAYGKIGASMERYFARLAVGRPVKRMNVCVLLCHVISSGTYSFAGQAVVGCANLMIFIDCILVVYPDAPAALRAERQPRACWGRGQGGRNQRGRHWAGEVPG